MDLFFLLFLVDAIIVAGITVTVLYSNRSRCAAKPEGGAPVVEQPAGLDLGTMGGVSILLAVASPCCVVLALLSREGQLADLSLVLFFAGAISPLDGLVLGTAALCIERGRRGVGALGLVLNVVMIGVVAFVVVLSTPRSHPPGWRDQRSPNSIPPGHVPTHDFFDR